MSGATFGSRPTRTSASMSALEVGNVTEAVTVTRKRGPGGHPIGDAQSHGRLETHNRTAAERTQSGRPRADGARSYAGRRQYRRSGRHRLAPKRPEGSHRQWLPQQQPAVHPRRRDEHGRPGQRQPGFPVPRRRAGVQRPNQQHGRRTGRTLRRRAQRDHQVRNQFAARRRFLVRPEHGAEREQLLLARTGPVEAQSVRLHGGRTVYQEQALRLHGLPEADHPPGSGQHSRADPYGGRTARRFLE